MSVAPSTRGRSAAVASEAVASEAGAGARGTVSKLSGPRNPSPTRAAVSSSAAASLVAVVAEASAQAVTNAPASSGAHRAKRECAPLGAVR